MAMLPATVWTRTFSTGVNGKRMCWETMRNKPKPIRLAGSVMVLTLRAMLAMGPLHAATTMLRHPYQPVCSPKYMLEKQITRPTSSPTRIPRNVKLRPAGVGAAGRV